MPVGRTSMVINDSHSTSFPVSTWKYGPHTRMQGLVLDLARAYKPHYSATSIYHYCHERHDTFLATTSNCLIGEVIFIAQYYNSTSIHRESVALLLTAARPRLIPAKGWTLSADLTPVHNHIGPVTMSVQP